MLLSIVLLSAAVAGVEGPAAGPSGDISAPAAVAALHPRAACGRPAALWIQTRPGGPLLRLDKAPRSRAQYAVLRAIDGCAVSAPMPMRDSRPLR